MKNLTLQLLILFSIVTLSSCEKTKTCDYCNGSGSLSTSNSCSECKGRGKIRCTNTEHYEWGNWLFGYDEETYDCSGGRLIARDGYDHGELEGTVCKVCNGTGEVDCWNCDGYGTITETNTCYSCNGEGTIKTDWGKLVSGDLDFEELCVLSAKRWYFSLLIGGVLFSIFGLINIFVCDEYIWDWSIFIVIAGLIALATIGMIGYGIFA